MFDPTIFENLRVVLEGAAYDLDLEGEALIKGRSDLLDLATMSRHYSIRLIRRTGDSGWNSPSLSLPGTTEAIIHLAAGLADWVGEKLPAESGGKPGCEIWIDFEAAIPGDEACQRIDHLLSRLWGEGVLIRQQVTHDPGAPDDRRVTASVRFQRKIDENQIDDLPELVDHVLGTLQEIDMLLAQE